MASSRLKNFTLTGLATLALGAGSYLATLSSPRQLPSIVTVTPTDPALYKNPTMDESLRAKFAREIEPSAVCIRDNSTYVRTQVSRLNSTPVETPVVGMSHGSGFVFTNVISERGIRECQILTNKHVATSNPILVGATGETASLKETKLTIVSDSADGKASDDIALRVVAVNPNTDMAILETVGEKDCTLPVSSAILGAPKVLGPNDVLMTTGYPFGKNRQTIEGQISSLDFIDRHVMPYPTKVQSANLSFDSGMSGSPVHIALVNPDGELHFYVVSLIYAGAESTDTVRLLTPMNEEAIAFIKSQRTVESRRPSLTKEFSVDDWRGVQRTASNGAASYRLLDYSYTLVEEAGQHIVRRFPQKDGFVLDGSWLDFSLQFEDGDVSLEKIVSVEDGKKTPVSIPSARREQYDVMLRGLLNNFAHQRQYQELLQQKEIDSETTVMKEYLDTVVDENANTLRNDLEALQFDLLKQGIR